MKKTSFIHYTFTLITTCSIMLLWTPSSNAQTFEFEITNCQELQNMSPGLFNVKYNLANDIDCSGTLFEPIGGDSLYFMGELDGRNHTIQNLLINTSSQRPAMTGLFGMTYHANIHNIHFEGANITTGATFSGLLAGYALNSRFKNITVRNSLLSSRTNHTSVAGGLVGYSVSDIDQSCVSMNILGNDQYLFAGGIAGINWSGKIRQSCSKGQLEDGSGGIRAYGLLGGLVGYNLSDFEFYSLQQDNQPVSRQGTVRNSYSTMDISISRAGSYVGGLFGASVGLEQKNYYAGEITHTENSYVNGISGYSLNPPGLNSHSFWDIQRSKVISDANQLELQHQGLTTSEMRRKDTYENQGWDFNNIWTNNDSLGYPYLQWEVISIQSCADLQAIQSNLNGNYKLANDIDCNSQTFHPIGGNTLALAFTGSLDGQGYTIRNLSINEPDTTQHVGIFSILNNARITNLVTEKLFIQGYGYVGGLAGTAYGYFDQANIRNIYINAGIINRSGYATDSTGGVFGFSTAGLSHVTSNSNITVYKSNAGGLVGTNKGSIINGTSHGSIRTYGSAIVGGLVGQNGLNMVEFFNSGLVPGFESNIFDSLSTMRLISKFDDSMVGGLVGKNYILGVNNSTSQSILEVSNLTSTGMIGRIQPHGLNQNVVVDSQDESPDLIRALNSDETQVPNDEPVDPPPTDHNGDPITEEETWISHEEYLEKYSEPLDLMCGSIQNAINVLNERFDESGLNARATLFELKYFDEMFEGTASWNERYACTDDGGSTGGGTPPATLEDLKPPESEDKVKEMFGPADGLGGKVYQVFEPILNPCDFGKYGQIKVAPFSNPIKPKPTDENGQGGDFSRSDYEWLRQGPQKYGIGAYIYFKCGF